MPFFDITLAELEHGVTCSGSRRAQNRDALDKLIAAHAVALDVVLVTNNEADFQGYPGLRIENWVGADYSIALDRLRDPTDPIISLAELRAELGGQSVGESEG